MARRFTARGGPGVEARIARDMEEITEALRRALPSGSYRSVVLMGGYGRGEGGVAEVDGEERPHNNYDFLIVARRSSDAPKLQRSADEALAPLVRRLDMGMDVGAIGEGALRRSPCRVMWYDLRFGHRPLLGDPHLVESMRRFRVERIEPWDVRNLLVNRGTLLVINDLLLERGELDDAARRAALRHTVKAIIGYGDAALFCRGAYHWSYEERQRRMRARRDVPEALRALYDEAMETRFRPRPGAWADRDLGAWARELRPSLAGAHLEVEAWRLRRPGLAWRDYPTAAFRHALRDGTGNARTLARRAMAVRGGTPPEALTDRAARMGYRTTPPTDRLALLFPAVAYGLEEPDFERLARQALGATGPSPLGLARAYLRAWAVHGDPNFSSTVSRLGIDLGGERAA